MIHALTFAAASFLAVLSSFAEPAQTGSAKLLEFEVVGRTDTDGPRPVLLALPPGSQDKRLVEFAAELYWTKEAKRLGWTVVLPIAPKGQTLSGGNIAKLLELVDHVEKTYEVEYGQVHVAGVSNGGRSAVELALAQPDRFASLSLLPGMKEGMTAAQLETLARLPLAMYVGGADSGWRKPMQAMSDALTKLGHPPTVFRIFKGEGHTPKSLTGEILFKALESFRVSAALEDFHDAASKADSERYFRHFAPDAIYMGTDATERWTVDQFKDFARPYFSKGTGWTYVARQRHAHLAPDGQTAWFDELLDNDKYGLTRGTGAFVRTDAGWKMTQYNLAFTVPNDLAVPIADTIRKGSESPPERK